MKQVIQNVKTGAISLLDVPMVSGRTGAVLLRNLASVVSAGTEREMLEFGRKNLLGKALSERIKAFAA